MWSWAESTQLEKLDRPPVVEVICGVHFDALDLDPVVVGGFWARRYEDFPKHQVHPAIAPRPAVAAVQFQLQLGAGPLRTWLLSANEALLVQVQRDRFYLNWRARPEGSYPRFSGEDGLLQRMLREFDQFDQFCSQVLEQRPVVRRIELGKVDHFSEGDVWKDGPDLAEMMPALAPILRFSEGGVVEPILRFRDEKDGAILTVALDPTTNFTPHPVRGIKLQTIVEAPADGASQLQSRFEELNGCVNAMFMQLIPYEQRKRFMGQRGDEQ